MHFKWQEITQSDGAGTTPPGNAASRSQARHTQKGVNNMTDSIKLTDKQKECADLIAAKAATFSSAQLIRLLGICEGISLAADVEKAVKEDNKGA